MNVDPELLWPGAALLLLLLLGTVAGLCVRCSRPAVKKSEKIYEQRSLEENQQNFAVARTYSLVRQPWPGPLLDTASDMAPTRKDKLLRFSPSLEDSPSSRYLEDFGKGSRRGSDGAYIDPIAADYYNWGQFQKPLEDEDDTNSYENVLICKQKDTESGDEGSEDYQNSASIRQWRESRRAVGAWPESGGSVVEGFSTLGGPGLGASEQGPREAPLSLAGSPDEEPDYVNESVVATEA